MNKSKLIAIKIGLSLLVLIIAILLKTLIGMTLGHSMLVAYVGNALTLLPAIGIIFSIWINYPFNKSKAKNITENKDNNIEFDETSDLKVKITEHAETSNEQNKAESTTDDIDIINSDELKIIDIDDNIDNSENILNYDESLSELKKLKNHGLLTNEEYENKVMVITKREEQKEQEKQKIIYEQRLNDKLKPYRDLLKDAKNKQLLSEAEYIKKKKEIDEKCKKEIEYEDKYRPQFSEISTEISDKAKAYITKREAFIRQLITKIEVGDVIVYGYGDVKKMDRNQWQTLIERDNVKDYEIIISFCEENIRKKIKDSSIVFYNNGNDNLDNNNLFEAIQDYDKAIEIDPSFAEAYYNRGVAKHNQNDFHGALTDYNKAIEINPNYGPAYFGRGLIKLILLDEKGGRQDIVKASELDCPEAKEKIKAIDSAKRKKDEFTLPDYP